MRHAEWVDYSGAPPILLPKSLLCWWQGAYLPADTAAGVSDLELPEGAFRVCEDFDFDHPKTDYDRACALGGIPAVQALPVGQGVGLVFATEMDWSTWWPSERMLVNGGVLPEPAGLERVQWHDELTWTATEEHFVLMNACDHGADPSKHPHFSVRLKAVEYVVQWGAYGWVGDDPSLILFRFVERDSVGGERLT